MEKIFGGLYLRNANIATLDAAHFRKLQGMGQNIYFEKKDIMASHPYCDFVM